jgi:hypothetical protein
MARTEAVIPGVTEISEEQETGDVSPNRRKFCHPRSRAATMASRSITFPSLWKV